MHLHVEEYGAPRQGMIEVHGNLVLVERDDHAGQLAATGVGEGENQTDLQLHVLLELLTRQVLHVVLVGLAERILRRHPEHLPLAGGHAEQPSLESGQQTAVAHGKVHRVAAEIGVDLRAVLEADRKVEVYASALADRNGH